MFLKDGRAFVRKNAHRRAGAKGFIVRTKQKAPEQEPLFLLTHYLCMRRNFYLTTVMFGHYSLPERDGPLKQWTGQNREQ